MQGSMAVVGVIALATVAVSTLADWRRRNRTNLDRAGFMPWPFITIMAMLTAVIAFGLALKGF